MFYNIFVPSYLKVMLQDKLNMDHELILKETESQYTSTLHAYQKEVKQLTNNFNHQVTKICSL